MLGAMNEPARRLEDALELAELAEEMMELSLRRRHPDASEEEIERRLLEWLAERPGARNGDSFGRVVTLPRK